jgi:hypothetical protein
MNKLHIRRGWVTTGKFFRVIGYQERFCDLKKSFNKTNRTSRKVATVRKVVVVDRTNRTPSEVVSSPGKF